MATLSDYMSGTISLANGSVTVTGTGTLFEVTRFREGDTLQIQNLTAVIASVDSNTQLTLAEPWTGASIVNGAYRARQLGDGSRVSTQAATIIELLGNGILANIAELGVEEGKTIIGGPTGEYLLTNLVVDPNGTLAKLSALTVAARQILQTDAQGNFTALTLTARQILQTDPNGALKQIALAANKALVTDANGDVAPINIGTLGRALLALATGTTDQYLQGDGTLQAKAGLPISTAVQNALNLKLTTANLRTAYGDSVLLSSVGAIGTYAFCQNNTGVTLIPGQGTGGTGISYASQAGSPGQTPPGNWLCMGHVNNTDRTLFFRYQ